MFKVWWDPIILKQMSNHHKNYTELCKENYFSEKNHSVLSKQLTNTLIKLCTLKMFRPVKIKLKVVNKCRACQWNFYCNYKLAQPCQNNLKTFS